MAIEQSKQARMEKARRKRAAVVQAKSKAKEVVRGADSTDTPTDTPTDIPTDLRLEERVLHHLPFARDNDHVLPRLRVERRDGHLQVAFETSYERDLKHHYPFGNRLVTVW